MMNNDYPVLYVFVREMASMNPGKAQAHSGHAANAFAHDNIVKPLMANIQLNPDVTTWMNSTPQGFGTQINLRGNWPDVIDAVNSAHILNAPAEFVTDPTYPYYIDGEIYDLLDPKIHTMPSVKLENGRFLCFRSEVTAAYIFGRKSMLESVVGNFGLCP